MINTDQLMILFTLYLYCLNLLLLNSSLYSEGGVKRAYEDESKDDPMDTWERNDILISAEIKQL